MHCWVWCTMECAPHCDSMHSQCAGLRCFGAKGCMKPCNAAELAFSATQDVNTAFTLCCSDLVCVQAAPSWQQIRLGV
jgi:hypothetical protein